MKPRTSFSGAVILLAILSLAAQSPGPSLVDPNLTLTAVVSGLVTPISITFLGPGDLLVLEKNTGKVQRVLNGSVPSTVLDLAVNAASERGLLRT